MFTDIDTLKSQFENEQVKDTLVQVFATRYKDENGNIGVEGFNKAEAQFEHLRDIITYIDQNRLYDKTFDTMGDVLSLIHI